MKLRWSPLLLITLSSSVFSAERLSLNAAVQRALQHHPKLFSQAAKVDSEQALVASKFAPASPYVGVSELNRGNSTTYATIMQKIDFPSKYFLRAQKQRHRASAEQAVYDQMALEVRENVISTYYALFSVQRIITVTEKDLQRLKEVSRIAESKYASGKAPQHDSMKAHVAQTQSETNLIALRQEEEALQAKLALVLNESHNYRIETDKDLSVPDVRAKLTALELGELNASPKVREKQQHMERASAEKRLAAWSYAPDFQLRYQRRIQGAPQDSHIVGIEVSIPLWFWGNASQTSSASYAEQSARRDLQYTTQQVKADLRVLRSQILSEFELIKIFDTSLIPQALTSYNSATAAYRANQIGFVDYLDTERALFQVEISRYRTLSKYISSLTHLETVMGKLVSNMGMVHTSGDGQ